jgi:hypothetical protein
VNGGSVSGPRVKGLAFQSVVRSFEELCGKAELEAAMVRMPAGLRNAIAYGEIVAPGWYTIEWYKELLAALIETSPRRRNLAMEIGGMAAKADLSGVYRLLTKVLSPETLFSGAARLFGNYYDTGTVRVIAARPGHAEASWEACTGFDQNMWDEIRGSCMTILELGGARHVRIHTLGGGREGDDFMQARGYWSRE